MPSDFLSGVTAAFGDGVRVTSGFRPQEEQDALVARGVTRATQSAHTRGSAEQPGAIDLAGIPGGNPRQVEATLRGQGYKVKKVIWETGKGSNQGTGPHYHVEFEDGSESRAPAGGSAPIRIPDVTQTQASPGERAAMSQPRDSVGNPFDPELTAGLRGAIGKEQERLGFADSVLQRVTAESQQVRASTQESLERTVQAKRAINDQTREDLARLTEVATPVWEKREQLAKQLLALEDMNPIEQGLRSLFDPNYNRVALRAGIRAQEQGLKALDDVFNERFRHAQVLSQLANADYQDTEALSNLILQNGGEDVRLALQSFNLAGQEVDTLLGSLQADSAIIAARSQARADIVSNLTIGQINAGLAQAEASDVGVAEINGVPIPAGMLQQEQAARQQQALNIANGQLAVQQGNKELEEWNKKEFLETTTIQQIKDGIANGGQIGPYAFDVTQLADRLQRLQQSNQIVAGQQIAESAPGVASQLWTQIAGTTRVQAARFASLFGSVPDEMTALSNQVSAQALAFRKGAEEAKRLGTLDEYVVTQLPEIRKLMDAQSAMVQQTVKRWARGNADVEAVGLAWMTGQKINSQAAAKALIFFAKNGIPAGTAFTGVAANALKIAREEVERDKQPVAATADDSQAINALIQGGGTPAEREAALLERVQSRLQEGYTNAMGTDLFRSWRQTAEALDLPFKRVSQQDWTLAQRYGDQQGLAVAANAFNARPEEFARMLQEGPDRSQLWKARVNGLKGEEAQFSHWQDVLTTSQLTETMKWLDGHLADTGFIPSREFARVASHPSFFQIATQGEKVVSNGSFGGFLAESAGGGNFAQNAMAMADLVQNTYGDYMRGRQQARIQRITSLASDPMERAKVTLQSIEGLSEQQEQMILRAIQPIATRQPTATYDPTGMIGSGMALGTPVSYDEINRAIDSFIMTASPQDPQLKAALAAARRQWSTYASGIDRMTSRQTGVR